MTVLLCNTHSLIVLLLNHWGTYARKLSHQWWEHLASMSSSNLSVKALYPLSKDLIGFLTKLYQV